MIILEEPYVSGFLQRTILELGTPVLDTPKARQTFAGTGPALLTDQEAEAAGRSGQSPRIYANSENALEWIAIHLAGTQVHHGVRLFKDKVLFRQLLADLYPDYRFQAISFEGLSAFDPTALRLPFVVKPAVGFFSLGVHVVTRYEDWPGIAETLRQESSSQGHLYPGHVLGFDQFIAEESIPGEEFAVDAYFDHEGRAVILNILGHLFASPEDVSDRVYYTSPDLVRQWHDPFVAFLEEVGRRAGLRHFPFHAELRVDPAGRIAPIEVNPLRFAGWCVTDLAHHAYGINPYAAFLLDQPPDWDRILAERQGRVFAVVVADLPSTVDLENIESVDYEAFLARFSNTLELRRVDFNRYPVFAFLFVETASPDSPELLDILGADLTRFLTLRR
ncbi:MAG: ATP-grasp domain-containing protein [Geothrix sp.]|nr:ATP-grasp domain-containing protein [Geothrix sp.]